MSWNYFTLRQYPIKEAPYRFASWKESQPIDRLEKMLMLQRCKLEIECIEHNIIEINELPPILKPDGEVHKTNMAIRTRIIKMLEKEKKLYQDWFDEYKMQNKKLLYTNESFRKTWLYSSQFVKKLSD